MTVRIITGDCREVLKTLPDGSCHCCVTSPPYMGLRDYQTGRWDGGDPACDHVAPARGRHGPASAKQVTSAGNQQYQYTKTCGKCGATRVDRQIGLELSPDEYVAAMVDVFREVRDGARVLPGQDPRDAQARRHHPGPGRRDHARPRGEAVAS